MKPKIYLYGTSGQYGNYLAALTEAGAEPVLSRDLFRACGCDGLLLPGGGDIGVTLEATDSFLIRSFADSGRPILGICHETLPILGVQWHPERQSGARLRADAVDAGPLLRYFVGQCSCKSAPGLVHCEKRGEADESHHTGTKSGAGTAYGG